MRDAKESRKYHREKARKGRGYQGGSSTCALVHVLSPMVGSLVMLGGRPFQEVVLLKTYRETFSTYKVCSFAGANRVDISNGRPPRKPCKARPIWSFRQFFLVSGPAGRGLAADRWGARAEGQGDVLPGQAIKARACSMPFACRTFF